MIRHLENLLKVTCVSVILILLAVTCYQVVTRYLLGSPSAWSEEFARILLMWLGMLGAAYTYGEGQHIAMETLKERFSEAQLKRLEAVVHLCSAVFACVMILGGAGLIKNAFELGQTTAALGISMGVVYLALPIAGLFILYYSFVFFMRLELK